MPCIARISPDSLDPVHEPGAEFIAPAAHGFITHHDAMLEQQLFNVSQAQLKPEIPTNGTTDDHRWKAMSTIERFRTLHLQNSTSPPQQRDKAARGTFNQYSASEIWTFARPAKWCRRWPNELPSYRELKNCAT